MRTPEGLHPTRFPSVRPRPLGESSVEQLTGSRGAPGPSGTGRNLVALMGANGAAGWLDYRPTPRAAFTSPTPPGPEGSKGTRALTGARGVPSIGWGHGGRITDDRTLPGQTGRSVAGSVPQVPTRHLRRSPRSGPRHRPAPPGPAQRPDQSRLPVQRAAGLRQDVQRADPGPVTELC